MKGIGAWFRTDYDEPVVYAPLPVELTSGEDPAVAVLDQTARGQAIVGRILGDFGAVAVNVRGTGRPLRVTVTIGLDDIGVWWWSDRVKPSRSAAEKPRLITVRAQGRLRGAVVLHRRQGLRRAAPVTASLSFDLDEHELDGEGLFIVEFGGPAAELPWLRERLCPRPAVGVRIDALELRERQSAAPVAGPQGATGCDFAVVQPGAPATVRLTTTAVRAAPPVPRNPRRRRGRRPARAAYKVLRAARRVAVCAVPRPAGEVTGVRATDLVTGADVAVELVRRDGHTELRLAGPAAGPVLLGSADPHPARSWQLR